MGCPVVLGVLQREFRLGPRRVRHHRRERLSGVHQPVIRSACVKVLAFLSVVTVRHHRPDRLSNLHQILIRSGLRPGISMQFAKLCVRQ
jgi:hypothetical protein